MFPTGSCHRPSAFASFCGSPECSSCRSSLMLAGKLGGVRLSSQHDFLPGYAPWMIVRWRFRAVCLNIPSESLAKRYWIAQVVLLVGVSILPSDVPEHTLRKTGKGLVSSSLRLM